MQEEPRDAVRVICNNDSCKEGNWMHSDCFQEWEQQVLSFLRSCGRARSWSEKQRLQNLWTKKGYDLVYRACDCKCGKGHLRKDTDYVAAALQKKQATRAKVQKSPAKPVPMVMNKLDSSGAMGNSGNGFFHHLGGALNMNSSNLSHMNGSLRPQLRIRTNSLSSTGSSCSPPSSAGTPPTTPGSSGVVKKKFDFFSNQQQAAAGNIFQRRTDYSVFETLPRYQQNPYHIKMEDEGPHGNDETRCFVLTNLSTHQVTNVCCVVCQANLPVFDKYPLIDGTFFLSPQRYNTDMQVLSEHRMLYLNAVCMRCLHSCSLRCLACRTPWFGTAFVIGSMYAYDVFAALPCCAQRLACKNCRNTIMDPSCAFQFFSEYSKPIQCPHCKVEDYHFIKQLPELYSAPNGEFRPN